MRAKAPLSAARRASASILIAAAAIALPSLPAGAHGESGGGLVPVPRPPAPPGDGAKAEQLIREIEARAARDPKTASVVASSIASAKKSIERGHGANASGDPKTARVLFSLALEWAETARDLERAAAVEQVASATAKSANDVATKVERARALLEETQARRGRAAAELSKVESEAKEATRFAADAEQQRLLAGSKGVKGALGPKSNEKSSEQRLPSKPQDGKKEAP